MKYFMYIAVTAGMVFGALEWMWAWPIVMLLIHLAVKDEKPPQQSEKDEHP